MPDDPGAPEHKGSWWQTLPGMLTAVAGLITAVTAMIVALNGLPGDSGDSASTAAVTPTVGAVSGAGATTPPAATETREAVQSAAYDVTFPSGNRATASEQVYELRGGTTQPRNPGELTLALAVRATNDGEYDSNFWDRSFRLGVGDAKVAPVSSLNELLPAGTSKDAVLEFAVPDAPGTYTLYVDYGDKVELPVRVAGR